MNPVQKLFCLCWRVVRLSFKNPTRLSHVLGNALSATYEVADKETDLLRFPQETVNDLLSLQGSNMRLTLAVFPKTSASISVLEYFCLVLLLKRTPATSVFEFGTYKGVSVTQLALNLPETASIYTLDLPDGQMTSELPISIPKDVVIAFEAGKGDLVPEDIRQRVHFLKEDSARFNPGPFEGQMDFVFVDGAHNAEYVRNDSEKGWRMLRPGGIIVWHDCAPGDPDVVRYLLKSSYRPTRIKDTSLAYALKP